MRDIAVRSTVAAPQSVMVERPGRADMRISVHGARPSLLTQQDEAKFDPAGRLIAEEHPEDLVVGTRMLTGIGQLHFGWFGGFPVRLAYGLLGLALCVVTSSGVTIWLARRRDRGRPAPQWERIWSAVCWGQPVVLALTALIPPFIHEAPLPAIWLALTAMSIGAGALASRWPGERHAKVWRLALAVALTALVLLHAGRAIFLA